MRARLRPGRRKTIVAAVLLLAALGCARGHDPRANLLLVTVDTLRPDRLACYGGPADAGLEICCLAEGGLRYRWAVSTAPSTAPSVASMLTSRYPSFHGVTQSYRTRLPDAAVTVAERLSAAGYDAAAFVSNPMLSAERNLGQGFPLYDDRMTRRERNRPDYREREAEATTDAALTWLAETDAPWFLWVHYQDPHGPYAPPGAPPVRDPADAERLPALDDHSGRGGVPAYQRLPGVRTAPAYEGRYLAEIRYVDREIGRLRAAAEAGGRPLGILLTADHGEAFGEDGYWFAHGHSVGLDQIRVPLLWRPPGAGLTGVVDRPVSTVDVAPTLLRAAGLELPGSFQGRTLPAPGSPVEQEARALFAEHRLRAAVVAGDRYYARDRHAMDGPVYDPVTGGEIGSLPPRAARLGSGDALPAYQGPGSDDDPLEALLEAYVTTPEGRVEPETGALPEATVRRLRALGYLE